MLDNLTAPKARRARQQQYRTRRQRFLQTGRPQARWGGEQLEPRLMLAADDVISVGRFLSAYSTTDVQNNELKITYSVFNQQESEVSGTLLTATLQPGVTFLSATQLPDQNGQELAWSLGTIPAFGWASVEMTVSFAGAVPLVLDDGAEAFGTVDARAVSDDAPEARLRNTPIDPALLASTVDANTTDPFIQAKAAQFDHDPNQIFQYLTQEVGYESYVGSLRGARGTLWAGAGNALDESSLMTAILRSSGIPARYVSGLLADSEISQLIASMFPQQPESLGTIPDFATISNPINDPQLRAETRNHYWVEFDAGAGFQPADPAFANAQIEQTFATRVSSFAEIADSQRHKVTVQLKREITNTANALFGAPGQELAIVLDETFNSVELVGHPLTVGHFVNSNQLSSVFTLTTNNYSPFIIIGQNDSDLSDDTIIRGTDYQETLTNFPFGSQILTGAFLDITVSSPGAAPELYEHTILDRIGFAARHGLGGSSISLPAGSTPAISQFDNFTINVESGALSPAAQAAATARDNSLQDRLTALQSQTDPDSNDPADVDQQRRLTNLTVERLVSATQQIGPAFMELSREFQKQISTHSLVKAYHDSPRLIVSSSKLQVDGQVATVALGINLLKNDVRAIAFPGQSVEAVKTFQLLRGLTESAAESQLMSQLQQAGPDSAVSRSYGAAEILQAARDQGIAIQIISSDNLSSLEATGLSPDAKARITQAILAGKVVLAPNSAPVLDGQTRLAWMEIDPSTGTTIDTHEDGSHSGVVQFAFMLARNGLIISFLIGIATPPIGKYVCSTRANAVECKTAFVAGGALAIALVTAFSAASCALGTVALVTGIGGNAAEAAAITPEVTKVCAVIVFASGATGLAIGGAIAGDPPIGNTLFAATLPPGFSEPNRTLRRVGTSASRTGGAVAGNVQTAAISVDGDLEVSWASSSAAASFSLASLNAASASVTQNGIPIGSGAVTLNSLELIGAAVAGNVSFSVAGSGNASVYSPATTNLGVSAQWQSYAAQLSGTVNLTLTTGDLHLNGVNLPAGTYAISTTAAALTGSGPTSSPNFAGAATIGITSGTANIGPATGSLSLAGTAVDISSGATLADYSGTLSVSAGGSVDSVQITGFAGHLLRIAGNPSALTTDQNSPVTFAASFDTTLSDDYTLTAQAPAGWTVAIDANGLVQVTPQPGLQGGVFPIQVTARSRTRSELVASADVAITLTPTQPGLEFSLDPDPLYFVPYFGAQVPLAYRATIHNSGPQADTFQLSFPNVPDGFEVLTSATSATIPAGETRVLGVYLNPIGQLPPPGTPVVFSVTTASTTSPLLTVTATKSFPMPAIHGVTMSVDSLVLATLPAVQTTTILTLRSVGNVPETVTFTTSVDTGLALGGLTNQTLAAGETKSILLTLTPAAGTPFNSTLSAVISADFGTDQPATLRIPVQIAVPGANAIIIAAGAANRLGNFNLENRLNDLSIAMTSLVQTPTSEVFKSQAVAALDAVIGLMQVDEVLIGVVPGLTGPRDALAAAVTESEVLEAVNQVGAALNGFGDAVQALANSNFELFLLPNSQVALPGTPVQFGVLLHNIGLATSTYNITLGNLPAGVTGSVSSPSVMLDRDGFATNLFVTLTPPANEVFPFEFQVNVAVNGAPQIAKAAVGTLTVRSEFLSVVEVKAMPAFVDPGGLVSVSTRLLNAVNRQQSALVQFQVFNAANAVVFTSASYPVELTVQTSLTTVSLGTVSTGGFPLGQYRIEVTVSDALNVPIPGATGQTVLLVGSPVTASLDVGPQSLPPGASTVTNSLVIDVQSLPVGPLGVLSQTDLPGAAGVVKNGHYVYASGTTGIRVFDIADPSNPQLIRTFGSSATTLEIRGDKLFALSFGGPGGRFPLVIYSLTDPEDPQFLGSAEHNNAEGIPYSLAWNMVVTDTHVFVTLWSTTFLIGGQHDIKFQTGDVLAIDVSDPTAPVFVSALLNTYGTNNDGIGQFINVDNSGGDGNLWEIVQLDANTLLVAGSTASGDNTQIGSGVVHVVDISDPAHMTIVRTLAIPGTVQAVGLSIEGNRALVAGSQGGWSDPANPNEFTGNLVLATLDISVPRNPVLIHSEVLNRSSVGPYSLRTTPLGNELFAFSSQGNSQEQPVIFLVDTHNPAELVTSRTTIPAITSNLDGAGSFVYATSPSGLIIYQIDAPEAVPVIAQVQVPTNTGVSVVPGSFNFQPTSILPGVGFDTLVWNLNLSPGTNRTLTWQTMVTGLQPGETRAVTLDTTVDFTVEGTPGEVTLPAEQVFAEQILALDPGTLTVAPGESAEYIVRIDNPSSLPVTYDLAVEGVPQEWVTLSRTQVIVPPNSFDVVSLFLQSDPFAPASRNDFVVTATTGGVRGSVQGTLRLTGEFLLPADPQSHGVVATLTPSNATAGQGTAANYVVRVTNTGSASDTFALAVSGLPAGFVATFAQSFIEIPPGAGNFRDVLLTIVPEAGTNPDIYPFTVLVSSTTSATTDDEVAGSLTLLELGVDVDIVQPSGPPSSTFQMVVRNTGTVAETFDLALAGPAALVSTLGTTSVTLAPGGEQSVSITVGQIDFAVPGAVQLVGVARARTMTTISDSDTTLVTIAGTLGLAAAFVDDDVPLPQPGVASFLLHVDNLGNLEDNYAVEIVSTSGNVLAAFTGLDGEPTSAIPLFILPGLSSGAFLLNVDLADAGGGTVTVRVRSLTNDSLIAEDTVIVRTADAPTLDFGDAPDSYGTLLGSNGARHNAVGPRLGLLRDSEIDGQPTSTALGDDNFGAADDEDGVMMPGLLVAGSCDCSGTGLGTQIIVNASGVGFLDAWIDFNRNGKFDANEKIANSIAVAAGANTLSVIVPAGASAGLSYARFRISSTGGLGPTGAATDGEVEDYAIQIFNPNYGTSGIIVDPNNAAANVLYIKGTLFSDAIVVRQTSPGIVTVYIAPQVSIASYSLASFSRIVICALSGSDAIAIEAPINKPSVIYGDEGNDSISGGLGPDTIFGGAGVDAIAGNAGDDIISGGSDNDSLVGGPGFDRLWERGSGAFTLTSTQFRVGNETNAIAQFEAASLFGGNASDSFNVGGWAFPVTIEGGGGTNTIIDSGNGNFTLTPTSLTRVIGAATRVVTFADIQNANLTGGAGNNSFNLSAWPLAATLSGGAGTDSFTVAGDVDYTLSDAMLLRPNLGMIRLSGFENALLTAGAADNTFTVSGWTKAATLTGGGGNDKLVSVANLNHTLTNTSLARTGRGTITLASIEQAELAGGAGNNTISAASFSGQVKLDGGGGNDTLTSGAGLALLLGGAGNDTLRAGSGRAVMIGGLGLDRLTGGGADDLLIDGQTAHDANAVALALLLAEWANSSSYAERVAHLTGTPGGLNGSARLDGSNVLHDTAIDILLGGAGNDLFFAKLVNPAKDTLSDKSGGETAI